MLIQIRYKWLTRKSAAGERLTMRITLRGWPPIDIATGRDVEAWDGARATGTDARETNRLVRDWEAAYDEAVARFASIEKRQPTPEEFRAAFDEARGAASKPAQPSFYDLFDRFVREQSVERGWSYRTLQKWATLRRDLMAYDPKLRTLTDEACAGFVQHLMRTGERNSTTDKKVDYLRWLIRWAVGKGLMPPVQCRPRIKNIPKEVVYLSSGELQAIAAAAVPPSLDRVRDMLLFLCFTGLRYSDASRLTWADVGEGAIEIVTFKTSDRLRVELNQVSRAVLDKYRGQERPLPVISPQKFNEYVKELGRQAGLDTPVHLSYYVGTERKEEVRAKWQCLSSHCGRRTFVVTALTLGIPAEVIMSWTGHKSFTAMRPYTKIVDELKSRSMAMFDAAAPRICHDLDESG